MPIGEGREETGAESDAVGAGAGLGGPAVQSPSCACPGGMIVAQLASNSASPANVLHRMILSFPTGLRLGRVDIFRTSHGS